jgi:uncharacterized protein with ParB-like and HNH nuclease domain
MDIKPTDKTVKNLLEGGFFKIPRFQRPYSWDRENVEEFWTDVVVSDDPDYFIGSFVLYGSGPASDTFLVVDGQQRLTTITLLLAAIRDSLADLKEQALSQGVQGLIERKDINSKNQFVLQSETPYPYLQEYIQKFGKPEVEMDIGAEEQALKSAYEFLKGQISSALEAINLDTTINQEKKAEAKRVRLLQIRDKILRLQLISINLDSEDDAYLIFETLNTRGKDLTVSDLVKNHLTRLLKPKTSGVDMSLPLYSVVLSRSIMRPSSTVPRASYSRTASD